MRINKNHLKQNIRCKELRAVSRIKRHQKKNKRKNENSHLVKLCVIGFLMLILSCWFLVSKRQSTKAKSVLSTEKNSVISKLPGKVKKNVRSSTNLELISRVKPKLISRVKPELILSVKPKLMNSNVEYSVKRQKANREYFEYLKKKEEDKGKRDSATKKSSVATKTRSRGKYVRRPKVPILLAAEESYRLELSRMKRFEMSDSNKKQLDLLNNKYNWCKIQRFKMTREKMEAAWALRQGDIDRGNIEIAGRTDSMKPRSLQLLLKGVTSMKERAKMIKIHLKPQGAKEKKIVKEAREQAARDKRELQRVYSSTFRVTVPKAVHKDDPDSLLSRSLQILLRGKKTIRERAYMMRIHLKAVSYDEKLLLAKARAQAKYEVKMKRNKDLEPSKPTESESKSKSKY